VRRVESVSVALALALGRSAMSEPNSGGSQPSAAARTGYFFVGGSYVEGKTGPLMERQMYVEFQVAGTTHASLSDRHDSRRGADRQQFHGNARRPLRVGRIFRRPGLRRIYRRPAGARALALSGVRSARSRAFRPQKSSSVFTAHEKFNLWPQANCTRSGRRRAE